MNSARSWMKLAGALWLLLMLGLAPAAHAAFTHPGGLHTQADFDRMAAKVAAGAQPWTATWEKLIKDPRAQLTWNPAPKTCICRTGGTECGNNYARTQEDAHAIYGLALRYRISGDTRYADRAIYIMDAWSGTLTGFCGDQHVSLAAGLIGYLFATGGEALRGYSGWSQASQTAWANMLVTHFYPKNQAFLDSYHDTCSGHYRLNWFTANMASMAAIGVFADREDIFYEAVAYFENGPGNGNISRAAWYVHENGLAQTEEAGRDGGHDMTGWDSLTVMCEIAWNQGEDLWGYDNNRVLRALEYTAKHNLGYDVPFAPYLNCDVVTETENYPRTAFLPQSWERAYNHYVNRKGLAAPYVAMVAASLRPDGPPSEYSTHPSRFDWQGLGSLVYTRDPIAAGAVPGGLEAKVGTYRVDLTWWGSAYATSYNVKRATTSGGPYTTIAVVGSTDTHYVDAGIAPGTTYHYVVSANNPDGQGANSAQVTARVYPWLRTHLKFDESSGATASDSSGNGLHGTLVNNATWAAGKYGNALNLAGASSQYVRLPSNTLAGLTDFTISAWVNQSTNNAWARLFDFGGNSERFIFLTPWSNTGTLRFSTSQQGSRGQKAVSATGVGTGWQHVAVTVAGANKTVLGATSRGVATLYVNGMAVADNPWWFHAPGMLGETPASYIGKSLAGADPYLNGKVDDFRVYAGALTGPGVVAVMGNTSPPLPPAPPAKPAAPSGLAATLVDGFQVSLSWGGSSGAHSYNVKRATATGGPYTIVDNTGGTAFTDRTGSAGTIYHYAISALNDGGESALSTTASVLLQAAGPLRVASYEMENNVNDGTGHNWHAAATGAPAYAAGKVGAGAIDLDGADDHVTLPVGVADSDDITIATWVYWDGGADWQRIFDFGNSTSDYLFLTASNGNGNLKFAIKASGASGGEQAIEGSPLPVGQWVHVAVTLGGNTGTLYVNGSAVAANSSITIDPSLIRPKKNYIGKSQWPDPLFNGRVDDFRIYNYALNGAQISALATGAGTSLYGLRVRSSGLFLDGMGRATNGSNCGQWSGTGSQAQQWVIESAGAYVKLRNQATGLYLDGMGRKVNGSACGQWSSSTSNNQQWSIEDVGSYIKLRNRATGLYLDGMGRTANGSDIGQWGGGGSFNQQFSRVAL